MGSAIINKGYNYKVGAVAESTRLRRRRNSREELPRVRGQGRRQEELPCLRGQGSRWEELPHVQGAVAAQAQEGLEELFHVQGQKGQR